LCGYSMPPDELKKHMVGHENCICGDWLYLGSKDNVNVKTMFRRRITHILNVADHMHLANDDTTVMHIQSFLEDLEEKRAELTGSDDEKYLNYVVRSFNWDDKTAWVDNTLTLDDHPDLSLRSASKFVHEAKLANNKVLVHCSMGISRSTTTVIAYLMEYEGMTLKQSWDLCKERRYIVRPNDGFIKKLGELEVQLKGGTPSLTAQMVDEEEKAGGKKFAIGGNFEDYKEHTEAKARALKGRSSWWAKVLPCCSAPR